MPLAHLLQTFPRFAALAATAFALSACIAGGGGSGSNEPL